MASKNTESQKDILLAIRNTFFPSLLVFLFFPIGKIVALIGWVYVIVKCIQYSNKFNDTNIWIVLSLISSILLIVLTIVYFMIPFIEA